MVYLCRVCLRLIRKYTNEIYPNHGFNNDESGYKLSGGSKVGSGDSTSRQWSKAAKKPVAATTSALPAPPNDISLMETTTPISGRKNNSENVQIAECIGDVRALLIQILCDDLQYVVGATDILAIMNECDTTFIQCFNAFYPTQLLKWNCLCSLLHEMDKGTLHPRLLSVVIAGLCDPSVNLKKTFSILSASLDPKKTLVSPSVEHHHFAGFPMLASIETYQYPVLVEQMIFKTQKEKSDFVAKAWNFNEVFVRLFEIISRPIRTKIDDLSTNFEFEGCMQESPSRSLVYRQLINNCCHLISKVLSEIIYQNCSNDADTFVGAANVLHSTGSRFAKCDTGKTWNPGNFGSDAIGFSVDRPGISIAGVCVYSGTGSYEYQLELMYDVSSFLERKSRF